MSFLENDRLISILFKKVWARFRATGALRVLIMKKIYKKLIIALIFSFMPIKIIGVFTINTPHKTRSNAGGSGKK